MGISRRTVERSRLSWLPGISTAEVGDASLERLDRSFTVAGQGRFAAGLRELDLSGNGVTDIAPLAGLTALSVLVLDGNAVSDLGPLTHLALLEHLGLVDNAVPDEASLQDLERLRRLDLGGNPVADLSPLGDVGSLEWLVLPGEAAAAADARAPDGPALGVAWGGPGTGALGVRRER